VHVTLRVRRHVWNLRNSRCFRRIESCFRAACGRFGVRLIEFSVQGNHVHLIVEADDSASLSRALQGLAIRIAKALNDLMGCAGAVFSDHYHSRLLRTPTELVRAICYVLDNHGHHFAARGDDPLSSAALPEERKSLVLCVPVGWLLREGWKRAGPLSSGPSG
jgi:REP element-mobilizing transposase RayT